jgi:uncharacterized iron-regulated membrane protein
MTVRSIVFWCHLTAGVCAGLVILLMSSTGVLLMYERQILAWADSGHRSTAATPAAERLPLETALAQLRASDAKLQPSAVIVRKEPTAPVTVSAGPRAVFVDAYSGAVLGESSRTGVRALMSSLRELHRWLALSGEQRATGRSITGWATVIFFGIICSGFYLWLPRRRTWQQVRAILFFRRGLRGKARNFNWHNAAGIWSAVPLFFIVLSALPISFPWANAAVYRLVGEQPPPAAARPQPGVRTDLDLRGLDRAFARATRQVAGWRSISVRLPAGESGYVFTIDRGDGGQPQLRDTLTVAASGDLVRFEPFSGQTPGRRLRSISRFTHTGEVLGIAGQTVAGMASAGAVLLVWTGLSLAWRRFRGARRPEDVRGARQQNAA